MNGENFAAGRFPHSLRMQLWSEHLGLNESERQSILDPVLDSVYNGIWCSIAKRNTQIYERVFPYIPSDKLKTWGDVSAAIISQGTNPQEKAAIQEQLFTPTAENILFNQDKSSTRVGSKVHTESLESANAVSETKSDFASNENISGKVEAMQESDLSEDVKGSLLDSIRGHIVCFPLHYLEQEDLSLGSLLTREALVPESVFQ